MGISRTYFKEISVNTGSTIWGLILVLLIFFAGSLTAQNETPQALKQQMAKIRQSTNWEDPVAAKKANDKIRELSKKLMMTGKPTANLPPGLSKSEAEKMQQEGVDDKMKLWSQMMNIARDGGAWDLAKPLREEIVQEYKDDEDPTVKNQEWLQTMPYLLINMSLPHAQTIIDQMTAFTGIKILIITCENPGTKVNLTEILKNASAYPLEEIYIINFGTSVTTLPKQIGEFPKLTKLVLNNNKLSTLPASISSLVNIQFLYADLNPVNSILSVINPLKKLKELGIAKTNIPDTEIGMIKNVLPDCKILK